MENKPKHCRSCREPIDPAAYKCPRCQSYQTVWPQLAPMLFAGIAVVLVTIPMFTTLWLRHDKVDLPDLLNENRNVKFASVRKQLTVKTDRFDFPKNADGIGHTYHFPHHGYLYCTVKNDSDYRWENLEFVVEFFDIDGQRLDLANTSLSSTIHPHSELECRLRCEMAVDPDRVVATKARITDATQPYR